MSNYITCEGCQRLIDLYPPPQRSNQQMWPSPTIFDTTVTIDSGRFCAECGKSRLLGKDIVKGYRVDDGSVLSRGLQPYFSADPTEPKVEFLRPEAANKTFTVTGGSGDLTFDMLNKAVDESKDRLGNPEQPELKFEGPK